MILIKAEEYLNVMNTDVTSLPYSFTHLIRRRKVSDILKICLLIHLYFYEHRIFLILYIH